MKYSATIHVYEVQICMSNYDLFEIWSLEIVKGAQKYCMSRVHKWITETIPRSIGVDFAKQSIFF